MTRAVVLLLASSIILLTAMLVAIIFLHIYRFPVVNYWLFGVTYSLTHWFAWVGTVYIFVASPAQPLIKRLAPKHFKTMLSIHMFGNLIAVLFISIHFAQQVTRHVIPALGTGVVLYASMILLVASGLARYLATSKRYWRQINFLHSAFVVTFYVVIIVHILHGLSII